MHRWTKTAALTSLALCALGACKSNDEPRAAAPLPNGGAPRIAQPVAPPATGPQPAPTLPCDPPMPVAPEEAKRQHLHGVVVASFTVEADGHVDNVRPLNPNSPPLLVQAVRDWLAHCPYTPQLRDGQPVATTMIAPFQFKDDAPAEAPR